MKQSMQNSFMFGTHDSQIVLTISNRITITNMTRSSADAQIPRELPEIWIISHMKELAIGKWPSRTLKVITIAAIRYAIYKYHFLLVDCCYNILS